ncbi:hypothetical protein EDC01DRAFT_304916 [Geopyxis carbonaria]|nr:hypothetical protein EDC01DRAFT_304916 [Geopyxis carbonaria]
MVVVGGWPKIRRSSSSNLAATAIHSHPFLVRLQALQHDEVSCAHIEADIDSPISQSISKSFFSFVFFHFFLHPLEHLDTSRVAVEGLASARQISAPTVARATGRCISDSTSSVPYIFHIHASGCAICIRIAASPLHPPPSSRRRPPSRCMHHASSQSLAASFPVPVQSHPFLSRDRVCFLGASQILLCRALYRYRYTSYDRLALAPSVPPFHQQRYGSREPGLVACTARE